MAIIRQFVSRGAVAGSGAGQVLFCAPSNQAVDVAASECLASYSPYYHAKIVRMM